MLARDYWLRLAGIDDRLGDVDEAAQAYYKVLAIDPADAHALAALEQLFTRTQRWKDLIGVVERRIEQTNDAREREALYGTMAQIYDERLGRPEDAVAAYKQGPRARSGERARALTALDDLFTRQKMWSELAENLESQLALAATDEAQLALMLRLAALRETRDGDGGRCDRGIPPGPRTRRRPNPQALARARAPRARTRSTSSTIADLLEPLYRHIGDWQKLVGVHEVQVRRSEDVTRRVELLHQIAQLYEDSAADLGTRVRNARARAQGGPGQRDRRSSSSIASRAPPAASRIWRSVFAGARRADRRPRRSRARSI